MTTYFNLQIMNSVNAKNRHHSNNKTADIRKEFQSKILHPFPSKRLREALSFGILETKLSLTSAVENPAQKSLQNVNENIKPLIMNIKLSRSSEKKLFELGYYLSIQHCGINWKYKDPYLYNHIKHLRILKKYRKPVRDYILGNRKIFPKKSERKVVIVKNSNSYWYVDRELCSDPEFSTNLKTNYTYKNKVDDTCRHSPIYNTARQNILLHKPEMTCSGLIENNNEHTSNEAKLIINNTSHKIENIVNNNFITNLRSIDLEMNNKSCQTDPNYNQKILAKMEKLMRIQKNLKDQNKRLSENLSLVLNNFDINLIEKSKNTCPKIKWAFPPELQSHSSEIKNLNKLFFRVQ